MPDDERTIAGRHVYTWSTRYETSGYIAPAAQTGTVGGKYVQTTGIEHVPGGEVFCTVKAVVDANDTITSVEYDGYREPCWRYSKLAARDGR